MDGHLPDSRVTEARPVNVGGVGDNAARQDLSGYDGHGAGLLTRRTGPGTGREGACIDCEYVHLDLRKTRVHSPCAERDHDHENGQQHSPTFLCHTSSPFSSSLALAGTAGTIFVVLQLETEAAVEPLLLFIVTGMPTVPEVGFRLLIEGPAAYAVPEAARIKEKIIACEKYENLERLIGTSLPVR